MTEKKDAWCAVVVHHKGDEGPSMYPFDEVPQKWVDDSSGMMWMAGMVNGRGMELAFPQSHLKLLMIREMEGEKPDA